MARASSNFLTSCWKSCNFLKIEKFETVRQHATRFLFTLWRSGCSPGSSGNFAVGLQFVEHYNIQPFSVLLQEASEIFAIEDFNLKPIELLLSLRLFTTGKPFSIRQTLASLPLTIC